VQTSRTTFEIAGGNCNAFVADQTIRQPGAKSLLDLQGRYAVIYADPPWRFATYSPKGEGRSASAHYRCMAFSDLCRLPIREHAASDCCLVLWTTDPMLPRAMDLIEAWGFTYKTVAFTWAKLNRSVGGTSFSNQDFFTGMGYWTRANPEQCLLATIGKPRRRSRAIRQLIISPRRGHSRKPDEAYGRIEDLVPGPYLELFARSRRPDWTAWGDQVGWLDGERAPTEPCHALIGGRFCNSARSRAACTSDNPVAAEQQKE
jgi:N6-adenosine-specific RNA methylase IME4